MSEVVHVPPLPVGPVGRIGLGWWGMLCVIATEAALFAYLLFAYFYYAVQLTGNWLPERLPSLHYALPGVILLVISGGAVWIAEHGVRRGREKPLSFGLAVALLLGISFAVLQSLDWEHEAFTLRSGPFGSSFFTLTGLHFVHVVVGLIALLMVLIWSFLQYFDNVRNAPVLIAAAYWYFVVVIGVIVFLALYVLPHLW